MRSRLGFSFILFVACNGRLSPDDATVASTCSDACHHVMACEGTNPAAIDGICQTDVCADAGGGLFTSQCGDASALINLFECLNALPCSDYPTDASTLPSAQASCIQQNCPQ